MVVETAYYEALELTPEASLDDIKKSYRSLARKYHPDKNSSPDAADKFKVIGEAYEVLSDPEAKQKYDKYGKNGVRDVPHHDPFDMFRNIFEGGGFGNIFNMHRQQQRGPQRTPDVVHQLTVTLDNLYNSKTTKLRIPRKVLCVDCKGAGGSDVVSCVECKGSGMKMVARMLGPGMFQQMHVPCEKCSGNGEIIKMVCVGCGGQKVKSEAKIVEVNIGKGDFDGKQIVLAGMANDFPGVVTGDVVVVLQQMKHEVFERLPNRNDLQMRKKLSLSEALTGFKFVYTHMDGRLVEVRSSPGRIIPYGQQMSIPGEGMPVCGGGFGDLYIIFEVEFPETNSLSEEAIKTIESLLPPKQMNTLEVSKNVII